MTYSFQNPDIVPDFFWSKGRWDIANQVGLL